MVVINTAELLASVFVIAIYFHPSLIFVLMATAYSSHPLGELKPKGRLLPMSTNVRLGWMLLAMAKELVYSNIKLVTTIKILMHMPSWL
jgi:hypothetical protein